MATLHDLSIIIPAFNAAHCIERVLRSLEAAGANGAREIIVVDDGSTDNTAAHAKRCAPWLPRLRVVRQANRGPGGARNHGLAVSTGKYVHFVDADDTLVEDAYRLLETALLRAPALVEFDYWQEKRPGKLRYRTSIPAGAIRDGVAGELAVLDSGLVWTKLIRRDLAERLPFPEARAYEDDPVMGLLPFLATPVVKVNVALYVYRYEAGSITRLFSPRHLEDRCQMAHAYFENCRRHGLDRRFPDAVEIRYFRMFGTAVWKAILKTGNRDRHRRAAAHSEAVRRLFPRIAENPFFRRQSKRRRLGLQLLMAPEARFLRLAEFLVARR